MDDRSWFRISSILENYFKSLVAGQVQSTVDNKLKLLRILFAMKKEEDWKEPFNKMFQGALKNILCFDCSQSDVENSIVNYHYRISEEGPSVVLMLAEKNSFSPNITEDQLCMLHGECQKVITKLVADHWKSQENETTESDKQPSKAENESSESVNVDLESFENGDEKKQISRQLTLGDSLGADECNSRNSLEKISDEKEAKNDKQPSEAEEQSSESDDDELENLEDGDDKTRKQISSPLSLGDNQAPDECNCRSSLGQVTDEKEAKINEQPSEAAEESSESVNVELENFEDGDDKGFFKIKGLLLLMVGLIIKIIKIPTYPLRTISTRLWSLTDFSIRMRLNPTVKQISSPLSLGDDPAPDECNSCSSLRQVTDEKEATKKQPSEDEEQSSESDDDELENLEGGDDKTSQLSLGDNPAPDECSSRSLLGQVTDENGFPSDSDVESSESDDYGDEKGSQSNQDYKKVLKKSEKKHGEHSRYWDENGERIRQENKKRLIGQPNYALTYYDVKAKQIDHKLFIDEQAALKWACKNINRMEKDKPFIKTHKLHKGHNRELTTYDFNTIDIVVINPSATKGKKRKGKRRKEKIIISKGKGLFDSGADIASVPYNSISAKGLIHSMEKFNDEWHPVVFGQLIIKDVHLKKIYPIHLDEDQDWRAFGIPQIGDMKPGARRRIMKDMDKNLTSKR